MAVVGPLDPLPEQGRSHFLSTWDRCLPKPKYQGAVSLASQQQLFPRHVNELRICVREQHDRQDRHWQQGKVVSVQRCFEDGQKHPVLRSSEGPLETVR